MRSQNPMCGGKSMIDKKGAQTKVNQLKKQGVIMRAYQCPHCNAWHLTTHELWTGKKMR